MYPKYRNIKHCLFNWTINQITETQIYDYYEQMKQSNQLIYHLWLTMQGIILWLVLMRIIPTAKHTDWLLNLSTESTYKIKSW